MINEILSVFDQTLREKCWIDTYGRLAITGKQKIGTFKRFPIAVDVISNNCDVSQYFEVLLPNNKKKAVSFWRMLSPISYSKIPNISSARRIKKAEATVQFVCWVNLKKISGETDIVNWGDVISGVVKDAVKALDCRDEMQSTGITGITNLKSEVVSIGDVETWRKAMSEYSVENLEAVSVWPFYGFTINVRFQFLVRGDCIEAYTCSSEVMCDETYYVIDENENALEDAENVIIQ